ncbi:hypothetical protein [Deinococcus gobiensis]|uniref:hypothetical protein n=1 Tax=Deinococcus gobiensis TaxID=502394 RepID=UPI001D039C6A|nr:hypothetical protein [Deinococcus gobiensis]
MASRPSRSGSPATGSSRSARRAARRQARPAPAVPPPSPDPAPLAVDLLTAPRQFGRALGRADTAWWTYWPVPVVTALLSGVAYALLLRPGLNLAAAETLRAAGQSGSAAPTFLSHVTNAFGSLFLTFITLGLMWGLGRLGAGRGRDVRGARVPEIFSASFALLAPLYLLVAVLVLITPAASWALPPAAVQAAQGNLLELQRAALHSAAQTPAALALFFVTLLGTAAQCALAYPALRETTGSAARAALGAGLPLLPALAAQLVGVAPLLIARLSGG